MLAALTAKKPTRQGPSHTETQLGQQAAGLFKAAQGYQTAVDRGNWDLARGKVGERADALGATSADVAIAAAQGGPATNANAALDRAMVRGKGLSRLISAKSNEFDSQLLRDRVVAVGDQRGRQQMGLQAFGQAGGMTNMVDQAKLNTKKTADEAKANTLGSIAGMGAGILANRKTLFPQKIPGAPAGGPAAPSYNPMTGVGSMFS